MGDNFQSLILFLAVVALLAAVFPQLMSNLSSDSNEPSSAGSTSINDAHLKEHYVSKKEFLTLKKDFDDLCTEMKSLNEDYNDLSQWTLEQITALTEAESQNAFGQARSFPVPSGSGGSTFPVGSKGTYEEFQKSKVHSNGGRSSDVQSSDRPLATQSWGERIVTRDFRRDRAQTAMESLNLYPQQKAPVQKIFDEALTKAENRFAQYREQGQLSGKRFIDIRNELRKELDDDLSMVLTDDQMETFRSLYERRNRYGEGPSEPTTAASGK